MSTDTKAIIGTIVIDEHVSGRRWQAIAHEGHVSQLGGSTAYDVQVEIGGQRLRLGVDGIDLLDRHLPHPLEGDQAGLFAWGRDRSRSRTSSGRP